jgi:hypothetical protein
MSIPKYVLLAWLALSSVVGVVKIGKPVKVTTPGVAAIGLVITATLAWLVVIA